MLAATGVTVVVALVAPAAVPVVAAGLAIALVVPGILALAGGRRAEAARVDAASALLRGIAGVGHASADLRANGLSERAHGELDGLARDAAAAERRSAAVADAAVQLAVVLAGVTAVAAAALLVAGAAPTAGVAVVGLLVLATGESLAAAVAGAHRLPGLLTALAPLGRLLSVPGRRARGAVRPAGAVRELAFHDVAVGWAAGEPVASGLEARVRRGEVLVVEGPSGSGKSTLLTTLLGDLDVRGGGIAVDGVSLDDLDPARWRSRVAWCPQEAHVFDSTLRGNLVIGRPRERGATDAELRDVLSRVGLASVVEGMQDGLDGRVGPGGRWLSGGERQRLAVARALLADAAVVLLDEPTAHLDAATADAVMSDLRRALADRIVVLVTHRATDRRAGDPVLRLGSARDQAFADAA